MPSRTQNPNPNPLNSETRRPRRSWRRILKRFAGQGSNLKQKAARKEVVLARSGRRFRGDPRPFSAILEHFCMEKASWTGENTSRRAGAAVEGGFMCEKGLFSTLLGGGRDDEFSHFLGGSRPFFESWVTFSKNYRQIRPEIGVLGLVSLVWVALFVLPQPPFFGHHD